MSTSNNNSKRRDRRMIGGYDQDGIDSDGNEVGNLDSTHMFVDDLDMKSRTQSTITMTPGVTSRRKRKLRLYHHTNPPSSWWPVPHYGRQGNNLMFVIATAVTAVAVMSASTLTSTWMVSATSTTLEQRRNHLGLHHPSSNKIMHDRNHEHRATTSTRRLQTLQQCQIGLAIGDTNRDDVLEGEREYPRFVNQVSGQQYSGVTSVTDLPQSFQNSYAKFADPSIGGINVEGSKPGQTPTPEQEEQLTALCTETIAILNGEEVEPAQPVDTPAPGPAPGPGPAPAPAPGPSDSVDCSGTVSRQQCNTGLAIADLSRDDLLNEAEYVRFVNRLSGNEYAGSSFDELPGNVKDSYNKFATTSGQVNIFGSKPGQSPDSTQDAFLDDFCCETDLAVQNPGAPTDPGPPEPPQPTSAPGPTDGPPTDGGGEELDCEGTVSRSQCNTALSIADLTRDDLLNEAEYVRFVNRLSGNEYASSSFDDLPSNIQATYGKYATTNGQVDITGSKPGQTATPEQDEFLDDFCCEADLAIQNPGGPVDPQPTSPPVPAPAPPSSDGTLTPTFADTFCRTAMASSDFNRDDQLNEEEYVRFLNRLTSNEFSGQDFSDLSEELQTNFVSLAGSDSQIDIFGSKPGQTADDQQEAFLDQICLDTAVALNSGGGGPAPTSAPDTPTEAPDGPASENTPVPTIGGGEVTSPPTFPPGLSEVYNSFIISNTLGLTAADLQSGANREGLDSAYAEFAVRSTRQIGIVSDVAGNRKLLFRSRANSSTTTMSNLRRRKLVVELVPESSNIYLLEDSNCPDTIQAINTCQTAFAQFQVSITDEDPQVVSDEYTAASQAQIRNGLLQTALNEVDPRNALDIVNASFPVRAIVAPTAAPVAPTAAPAPAPPSGEGGGGDDGSSGIGGIIGGIIGALVVIAIGVYIYFRGLPCDMSAPSFKFGGRSGNRTDDEDDGEGGFDKDDDASVGDKDDDEDEDGFGINGFGSPNKNTFGDDDDDDDDDEKGGQDAKNVFGFRKKDKEGGDKGFGFEEDYGLDSKGSAHNSFGDENGGGKYEFDEPSEVREDDDDDDDDDDKGSLNANEDPFGAAPASWGNTFGSGNDWGANNGAGDASGEGQNFFGESAFVGNEDEEDGSRSGSGSESYSSSEDSTYESEGGDENSRGPDEEDDYYDDEGSGSYSRSSADDDHSGSYNSGSSGSMASELRQKNEEMDDAIESGDWDAVAKAAGSFGKGQEDSFETSSKSQSDGEGEYSDEDGSGSDSGSSRSESISGSAGDDGSASSATTTSEDLEKREEYRAQVDALVKLVLPDEVDKVDAMMEQFKGREAELVSTLQTMQERSANQRARAAVHKSKTRPTRAEGADGAYALGTSTASGGEGAAAGTAAIAAASLPIPAAGMFGDEEDEFGEDGGNGFGGDDAFGEDPQYADDEETGSGPYSDEGSYSGSGSRSRSQYSGSRRESERSGSRSYYSDEDGSRSYNSREEEEGSFSGSGSRSRSQYSGSRRESERSGSRSYYSDEDGSRSYDDSRPESQRSGSQSYYDEEGSRSQSHNDEEVSRSQSHNDEEGSRSQSHYDDEGSRSQYSGSRRESERSGSRSYYSDEDGSRSYDDSRPDSQRSGSQSYYDEEGSRSRSQSQRSGSQSYYSNEDGSRSYYSDEDGEGSFAESQGGEESQSWGE